jgi:hypothetical protein
VAVEAGVAVGVGVGVGVAAGLPATGVLYQAVTAVRPPDQLTTQLRPMGPATLSQGLPVQRSKYAPWKITGACSNRLVEPILLML